MQKKACFFCLEFRGRPMGYSLEFRGKEIKNRLPHRDYTDAHSHSLSVSTLFRYHSITTLDITIIAGGGNGVECKV